MLQSEFESLKINDSVIINKQCVDICIREECIGHTAKVYYINLDESSRFSGVQVRCSCDYSWSINKHYVIDYPKNYTNLYLKYINSIRAKKCQNPLDPAEAGWNEEDIRIEAVRLGFKK